MRRVIAAAAVATGVAQLFLVATAVAQPTRPSIAIVTIEGAVDPLVARYVDRSIEAATTGGAGAVLIRIDTPGGLDSSMRRIIQDIQASRVPVICWVGPAGSRAASAGAIIMLGCPNTAMARGTNIGAAHPVGFQGEVLDDKITNDAAAYARALAERYERDPQVAEDMVRKSLSLSAEQALERKVVDLLADDRGAVLRAFDTRPELRIADGATGTTGGTFGFPGARIEESEMTFMEGFLHRAVDPNLAFILLSLGLLGIVVEILHPGISVPGIVGSISFLGALVILGMLPVNLAGVILILVGVGLLGVEAYIAGFSGAGAAGVVALALGGLFLFDASVPSARVSRGLVAGTALALGLFFYFVVRAVVLSRRRGPTAPTTDEIVGSEGIVVRALTPTGIVRTRNEDWSARSTAGPLADGTAVRVVRVDGLTLEVEPITIEATHERGESR